MYEVVKNGRKIVFIDDIKKLSIRRYQKCNKYTMIGSEVGSDFSDFENRSVSAIEFLKKGMVDKAVKELENRRQTVWNAYSNFKPEGYALALLIYSIDGVVMRDISDEHLDNILDDLERIGFTYQDMEEAMSEVKKK